MQNQENERKIVLGLLMGVAVGIAALHLYSSSHSQKPSILHRMGQTMCEVGELLESSQSGSCKTVLSAAQKNTSKGSDVFNNLLTWFSSGIELWKKIIKGE